MKNLRTTMVCACILLGSLKALAQNETVQVNEPDYNKPLLFSNLPPRLSVNTIRLTDLLEVSTGTDITVPIGEMQFTGRVVSTSAANETNLSSIVVRSSNYPRAVLTFTRTVVGNEVAYSGRIISMQHGDLYELKNNEGQYEFIKKNFYDLVNE